MMACLVVTRQRVGRMEAVYLALTHDAVDSRQPRYVIIPWPIGGNSRSYTSPVVIDKRVGTMEIEQEATIR